MSVFLTSFDPPASATEVGMTLEHKYVNPNVEVSFDVTSDTITILQAHISVYFNTDEGISYAIDAGVPENGFNVTITSTTVSGNPGFHVSIIASDSMDNTTVLTDIRVDDGVDTNVTFRGYFSTATYPGVITVVEPAAGTPATEDGDPPIGFTFSGRNFELLFQLNDVNQPAITNRVPVVGSSTASTGTTVQFSVHDYGVVGVNNTTLFAYINGVNVISNGSFVYPYIGTIVADTIDTYAGFTIVINSPSDFVYSQLITIRVVVGDLADDPGAVNTLDTSYTFNIQPYVDTTGPGATPTQPPTGLGLDACIEFDWLDDPGGPGPDWNTLNVTLRRETTVACITSIRDSIAVVNGVASPGYTVFGSAILVGTQVGFHVLVCPDTPFNELEIITVIIDGSDESGFSSTSSFAVSTVETTPPTILNISPVDGATNVDHAEPIYFEMHDSAGSGVDVDNISINVDDSEAVINGVAQPGFNLSVVNDRIFDELGLNFDGYEFTLTRDTPWYPSRHISVDIDGYDAYGNRAVEIYSFVAAPDIDPPVVSIFPPNGGTGFNRDQNVVVDVIDILGQGEDGADIWVKGEQAVLNGAGVAPFDVYIEGITDGYRYIIDSEYDFGYNEVVSVKVVGRDLFSNSVTRNFSFRTFNDTSGPTLSNISPGNGQEEVSLNPSIVFTVRDGYDVAGELTEVMVNGELAFKNGLPQSGYILTTDPDPITRISGGTLGVDPGDGYIVELTRVEGFQYSQTVVVSIEVYDRGQNNQTYQISTWHTIDPRPPILDFIPITGDYGVAIDTNISFEIFSDGYGVDISTLDITLDDVPIVTDGVVQGPNYIGTILEVFPNEYYVGEIDPRYLLRANAGHTIRATVQESTSDNEGSIVVSFDAGNSPENPETLYIGGTNGVVSIPTGDIDGYTEPTQILDGYYVYDLSSVILNEINRLAVATRDHGAFVYATNYAWPTGFYSVGDEITKLHFSTLNDGTLYLANRSRGRVDVYYNILGDDAGRSVPDVYYAAAVEEYFVEGYDGYDGYFVEGYVVGAFDGYAVEGIRDGYFTDMVVTESTSSVDSNSSTIFLGTHYGLFKIDTDESVPGATEIHGELSSYGIPGGNFTHGVFGGNTNMVEAIDVNTRLNYMYVATRGYGPNDVNALTYIDLSTNTKSGVLLEAQLIHRLINDINFQD